VGIILERDPAVSPGPEDIDGMQEYMGEADAPLSTDWDILVENPPHEGYSGPLPHPDLEKKQAAA
jgi:hypothetical protein